MDYTREQLNGLTCIQGSIDYMILNDEDEEMKFRRISNGTDSTGWSVSHINRMIRDSSIRLTSKPSLSYEIY